MDEGRTRKREREGMMENITTTNDPKKAYARLCRYWTPERIRALAEQNMRDRLARHPEAAQFRPEQRII